MVNFAELVAFCVDEIGLEGPDGCTLQRLWTLITDRFPSKVNLTKGLKQHIWQSLVKLSQRSCLHFTPPLDNIKPRPAARAEQSELVVVASDVVQFRSMGVLNGEWMSKGVLAVLLLIAKSREEGILMSDLSSRIVASGVSTGKGSSNYRVDTLVKHELVEKIIELQGVRKENRMRLKRFALRSTRPLGYPLIFHHAYERCVEAMQHIYEKTGWKKVVLVDLFELVELESMEDEGKFPMMRKRKVFQVYLEKLWQTGVSVIELQRCSAYCVTRNVGEEASLKAAEATSSSAVASNESQETSESGSTVRKRRKRRTARAHLAAVLRSKPLALGRDGSTRSQREQRVEVYRSYVAKHVGSRSAGVVWGEAVPEQAHEIIRRAGAKGATLADLSSLLHLDHREAGRLGNRLLALDESLSGRKDLGTKDAGNNRTSHLYIVSSDPRATAVPEDGDLPTTVSKQDKRKEQALVFINKHKICKFSLILKCIRNSEVADEMMQSMLSRRTLLNLLSATGLPSKRAVDIEGSSRMHKSDLVFWDPTQITPTPDDFIEALLTSLPTQRGAAKSAQSDALSQASGNTNDGPPLSRITSWADVDNRVKDKNENAANDSILSFNVTEAERKQRYKELRSAYPLGTNIMKRLQHLHKGLWRLATNADAGVDGIGNTRFTPETFPRQLFLSDLLRSTSLADRHKIPVRVLSELKAGADAGLKLEDLDEAAWHVVGPASNFEVLVEMLVSLHAAKWQKDHTVFTLTDVGWCPRKRSILCSDEEMHQVYELESLEDVDKFYVALKDFTYFFHTNSPTARIPQSHDWLESGRWGLRSTDIASMRRNVAKTAAVTKKLLKSKAVTTLMETVDLSSCTSQAASNEGYSSTDETEFPEEDKVAPEDEDEDSSVDTIGTHMDDDAEVESRAGGSSSRSLSKIAALFEGDANLSDFKERFGKRVYVSLKYVLEIDVGDDALYEKEMLPKAKKVDAKQLEEAKVQDWVLRQRCLRVLQCKGDSLDREKIRAFLQPFKDVTVRRCLQDMAEKSQLASLHLSKNDVMTVLYEGTLHPRMTKALDEWDEKLNFFQPLKLPLNKSHAIFVEPDEGAEDVTDERCFSLIAGVMSGHVQMDAVLDDHPIEQIESARSAPKEAVHNLKRFDHISKVQAWTASKSVNRGNTAQPSDHNSPMRTAKKRTNSLPCESSRKRHRAQTRGSETRSKRRSGASVADLRKKMLSRLLRKGAMGMKMETVVESPEHREALDRLLLEEKVIKVPCDDHYRLICMEFQEDWQPNWKWLNPDGSVGWRLKSKMLRALFASVFFAPFVQRKSLEERFGACIVSVEIDVLLEELIQKHKLVVRHEDGSYVAAMENLLGIDALRETSKPS